MPTIFSYTNYRSFLGDDLAARKAKGQSFRQVATACGISSPNFLQQVVSGQRNLTAKMAKKIAVGLELSADEADYLSLLIELEHGKESKEEVRRKLMAVIVRAQRLPIKDPSIHSSWLHAVLWELAGIQNFVLTPDTVAPRIRGFASKQEIQESLEYLLAKGYLVPTNTENVYSQREVAFEALNDVRRIEVQQCHFRMLEIAKHKINDDLANREFQGLTVAIPAAEMDAVKQRVRDFILSLNSEFSHRNNSDTVIHVHCGAYKLIAG